MKLKIENYIITINNNISNHWKKLTSKEDQASTTKVVSLNAPPIHSLGCQAQEISPVSFSRELYPYDPTKQEGVLLPFLVCTQVNFCFCLFFFL